MKSFEKLLDELGDHFIGLWRYRVPGVRRYYCVTVHVNGNYYDSRDRTTVEAAMQIAIDIVRREQRKAARDDDRRARKKRRV